MPQRSITERQAAVNTLREAVDRFLAAVDELDAARLQLDKAMTAGARVGDLRMLRPHDRKESADA